MGAGLSLNGRRSSSRFPVSAAVAIAAVHAHINGAFSAYPSLHNLPGLMTCLDVDDVVYHAEDESPHDADEHSQLPRSYPQAGVIDRLHRVPGHLSTPRFSPRSSRRRPCSFPSPVCHLALAHLHRLVKMSSQQDRFGRPVARQPAHSPHSD